MATSSIGAQLYRSPSKYWREAATIIIAAGDNTKPHHLDKTKCDYSFLMLQRSGKSKFMPHKYVYPGGVVHNADFSPRWVNLFTQITGKPFNEIVDSLPRNCPRPPMMEVERNLPLPAEIAFRICAIREAFEEAGILLATDSMDIVTVHDAPLIYGHAFSLGRKTRHWRNKVQENPDLFIDIFLEHKLVPDIWSLAEWSNWLTPVMQQIEEPPKKPHRFDTMFYMCCLSEIPRAKHDKTETVHYTWINPSQLITDFDRRKIELAGPQIYEPSRMVHFHQLMELCLFSQKRQWNGISRTLPVAVVCSDGALIVYEGDDLYPEKPDFLGLEPIMAREETMADLAAHFTRRNRMALTQRTSRTLPDCNITDKYGHRKPISTVDLKHQGKL